VPRLGAGPPDAVRAIGLLTLDASGALTEASQLYPYDGSHPLLLEGGAADVTIIGYADGKLTTTIGNAPLRAPATCEAILPSPIWAAVWKDDGLTATSTSGLPALTATAWDAAASCPDLSGRTVTVDIRCPYDGSVPAPLAPSPGSCDVAVDLGTQTVNGAPLGSLRARVDAEGRLCVDPSGLGPSCSVVSSTPLESTVECSQPACNVEVHFSPELTWGIERFPLLPGAGFMTPSDVRRQVGLTAPPVANTGYTFDLARLSDRIMVATATGWVDQHCGCKTQSALLSLDLGTLQPIQTIPTGPCMTHLTADPNGDGVFAAELHPVSHLWLFRHYAKNGRIVATATITDDTPNLPAPLRFISSSRCGDPGCLEDGYDARAVVALTGTSTRIALILGHYDHSKGNLVVLFDHDLNEIPPRLVLPDVDGRSEAAAYRGSQVVLGGNTLAWLDLAAGSVEVGRLALGVGTDSFELRYIESLGQMAVAATGGLLFANYPPGSASAPLERTYGVVPSLISTIEARPSLLVAAGTWLHDDGMKRDAAMVLYDEAAGRFLPGIQVLGQGVAMRLTKDDAGRVIASLPWTGELVRVTPK
jgi:hypothetical protein